MPPSLSAHRLRKHADYQHVYRAAVKQHGRLMAWFAAVRAEEQDPRRAALSPGPRIGLTVPKALGKAVDRNRIKRRVRAAVAPHLELLAGDDIDVILHPRRTVLEAQFGVLEREIAGIFTTVARRAWNTAARPGPQRPKGKGAR